MVTLKKCFPLKLQKRIYSIALKSFEIDVTNKTPERILEKIDGIINNQKGGDIVDWLRLVEEKNEIGEFFDY